MDEITKEDFEKAARLQPEPIKKENIVEVIDDDEFQKLIADMESPVKNQQAAAVQAKIFLDKRMKEEMQEKGILSDHTRRWFETYINTLEKIQKALYGDKSVNLHVHKGEVSHFHVAKKIREVRDKK